MARLTRRRSVRFCSRIERRGQATPRARTARTPIVARRSHAECGLIDEPRPGRPRTVTDEEVEEVIVRTLEGTPSDATHRSTRSMAREVGLTHGGAVDLEGVRAPAAPPGDVEAVHGPLFIDKVRDDVGLYLNRATAGWRCVSMRSSKSRRWIAPRRSRRCCPPPPERATDDVLPALSPRSATLKDAPYRVAGVACRLLSYADAGGSKAPAVSDVILGVPLPGVERLGYCIARLRAASATDMAVQGRHRLWGR
jgi:hypothetical protein